MSNEIDKKIKQLIAVCANVIAENIEEEVDHLTLLNAISELTHLVRARNGAFNPVSCKEN